MKKARPQPTTQLCECVQRSVERYFQDLNGEEAGGVYQMVLGEVEKPLLVAVLKYADENHSKAARVLGINRSTLRKKLELHGLV